MYHILVCDDDRDIVAALKIYLTAPDHTIYCAYNGQQALEIARQQPIELILMDIMMPGLDGITATARLRASSNIPVILLTAKTETSDKILGLNVGADDYITKPFDPMEVLARVKSQLRRYTALGGQEQRPSVLRIGAIALDDEQKTVSVEGEAVALTPTEYAILKLLMQNAGRVYATDEIYREVWGDLPLGGANPVAVHIRHLREKIEINPSEPRWLKVVWGQGYKFEKER